MGDKYEWGRAARLRCYREYLGLSVPDMSAALKVGQRSYQRFENGQAAIPSGIWPAVEELVAAFDDRVAALLDAAGGGAHRVKVWRGAGGENHLPPGYWLRAVAEAMMENPAIEPFFPEDGDKGTK